MSPYQMTEDGALEPNKTTAKKRGALLNIPSTTLGKYGGFMAKINYYFHYHLVISII